MSDDDEKEERTKSFLLEQARRASALRSHDREFHGLEREFMYLQADMLVAYNKSKDIKHPRDVGDSREQIVRQFLTSGYLPQRYGVSQTRARVASTTGHVTGELDILLYDALDTLSLMKRENVYEVFPVDSIYGMIQVKSRLNKTEIREGLENIASFKRLEKEDRPRAGFFLSSEPRSQRGFGLLFAYDSDLAWRDIIREIESFSRQIPNTQWCNAVFILSKGMMLHGEDNWGASINPAIERIAKLSMHGYPDRQNQCLYQFYSVLLNLLRTTDVQPPNADSYFRLPLVAAAYSYEFCFGAFAEMGRCEKHGDYQRKIAPEKLERLIDCCAKAEPINWIKAVDLAYGKPGDNTEAYAHQPGDVRIYNSENLPLADILVMDQEYQNGTIKALAFDQIRCAGMVMFVPYYYTVKEGIISGCPKCV